MGGRRDEVSLPPNGLAAAPAPLTRLIGREQELGRVGELLTSARVLTLIGSGGVGKTHLALAVAKAHASQYRDGVAWIDLAPLADPALVPQVVAAAVGLPESPGRPLLDTLRHGLRDRRLLAVIDNAEHLVDAVAGLVEALLRACPTLTVLATSREALGVEGEIVWRVPSLAVPAPDQALAPDDLVRVASVALFLERIRAVLPDVVITAETAAAVAEVCRRLDGIPLALELAAARVPGLGLRELAARLDDRFRLLTGGRRTALRRQQTLQATIDWSHDLLSEPERVLLRRLAVFAGSWELAAAEAVCGGAGLAADEVPELLSRLVSRSLVLADEQGGAVRYRLLETMRQYAGDKLMQAGEVAAVRHLHLAWYLDLAEQAATQLHGLDVVTGLARLEADHDNLRAALEWALATEDGAEAGLRLAGALGGFWFLRDYLSEGRRWLKRVLAQRAAAAAVAVPALLWAVQLARHTDAPYLARCWGGEALAMAADRGDAAGVGRALTQLAWLDIQGGNYRAARTRLAESLAAARTAGEWPDVVDALFATGQLAATEGEYATAWAHLDEMLRLARERQSQSDVAFGLGWLGLVLARQGAYQQAKDVQGESLAIKQTLGMQRGMAFSWTGLGLVAQLEGDVAEAATHYRAALQRLHEIRDRPNLIRPLEGLAWVALAQGLHESAARWLGAVAAMRAANGLALPPSERAEHERAVATTRTVLGETIFAAAWAAGQAQPPEAVVAEAMQLTVPNRGRHMPVASRAQFGPLSAREREVASLVAAGLTSRQIAAALSISSHTAERHVDNIRTKLGLTSRAQVAVWAVAHGLAPAAEA